VFAVANTGQARVAVVGSINTDLVVFVPRLPTPGETVSGQDLLTGGGGKGANQAVAAARLGAQVRMLARVGEDDFGREALAQMIAAGISSESLLVTPRVPSGVALIFVAEDNGQNMIAIAPGANMRVTAHDVDDHWPHLGECQVLLLQLEVPNEATLRAAQLARRDGLKIVLNPAPAPSEPLPPELLELADVVVPNENEARRLTGVEVADLEGAERAAKRLRELGARAAIVTLGERGALVYDGTATHVPPAPVKAIDATAAGDAFCGGLGVALARGDDLVNAACFASAVAGRAVEVPGAQASMPTLAEVESLRARWDRQ
jgi:ribokinase